MARSIGMAFCGASAPGSVETMVDAGASPEDAVRAMLRANVRGMAAMEGAGR